MNLDEQLPGLLAREAEHADVAPPTREGVQTVVSRRTQRRRRQRVGLGMLAGICLIAGAAGGVALSSSDNEPVDIVPVTELPTVPPIGIDAPGLTLSSATEVGVPAGASSEPPVAVFTPAAASPVGPVIVAYLNEGAPSVLPSIPSATRVDLDGDGATGGQGDGRVGRLGRGEYVTWTMGDGNPAAVGGYGVARAEIVDYARSLGRHSYSLETVPAPDGFPGRVVTGPASAEFLAIYTSENGTTMFVSTTNAPGRFDARRVNIEALVEVPLGISILGDGVAVVSEAGAGAGIALVRTDAGLTVEISGDGLDRDTLRDLLADGRIIEVEPTADPSIDDEPAATTASIPSTPAPDLDAISEPGCDTPAGSPTSLADEPERWLRFGSYDRWRDLDGCPVRIDVISSGAGSSHCDWESAHFITIGDPLGTSIRAGVQPGRRRYVWNGDGVISALPPGRTIPVLDADEGRLGGEELNVTAEDTGYRWGDRELWLDPEDEDTLYAVDGDEARVYVREADAGLCE